MPSGHATFARLAVILILAAAGCQGSSSEKDLKNALAHVASSANAMRVAEEQYRDEHLPRRYMRQLYQQSAKSLQEEQQKLSSQPNSATAMRLIQRLTSVANRNNQLVTASQPLPDSTAELLAIAQLATAAEGKLGGES